MPVRTHLSNVATLIRHMAAASGRVRTAGQLSLAGGDEGKGFRLSKMRVAVGGGASPRSIATPNLAGIS
jgi:hypothetical protein